MRMSSGRAGDSPPTADLVAHALAAWETDGGARLGDGRAPSGEAIRLTRVTRLALIWPYAGVIAGIAPLEPDAIEGIVADGYQVLAVVRDQPPYTHVIGVHGGQDYLATLATVWANPVPARRRASSASGGAGLVEGTAAPAQIGQDVEISMTQPRPSGQQDGDEAG
jgi:hypothetical protein